jgi:histidinol phosphatase-like PHP family hydrolase
VKNIEVARLFDLMADLLEIRGDNPFRIRAYRRAAQSLESLGEDVEAVPRAGRLDQIPGVGRDLAGKIDEYLRTGRMKVSDHSRSATVAGGLSAEELSAHVKRIREVQRAHPEITILASTGCDILPDGSMDYPDEILAGLDIVVGAVHSRFTLPKPEMTRRICRALANPYVSILAHPTGRLHGEREAYDVDLDEVFQAARRHGKAVEINAFPARLDLGDVQARRAGDLGALIAIGTDAHQLGHLGHMELGVATARRAWIEPPQVVNTWPVEKPLRWAGGSRAVASRTARTRGRGR